jgi:hypothetical protein
MDWLAQNEGILFFEAFGDRQLLRLATGAPRFVMGRLE